MSGRRCRQNPTEAVKWFQRAADHGFARAQNNLGIMYDNGNGVAKNPILAFAWFTKAAEQEMQMPKIIWNHVGEGDGIAKDPVEAVKYFKKAAEQGQMLAQNNLALACANGDGTAKTLLSLEMVYQVADQGYVNAQNNLGSCMMMVTVLQRTTLRQSNGLRKLPSRDLHAHKTILGQGMKMV